MKNKEREARKTAAGAAVARAKRPSRWPLYSALGAALFAVWWAYSPAFHGPFLFDDTVLPFSLPGFSSSLADWLRYPRPLTMLSFWVNAQISGDDPFSYHVLSALFHLVNSGLVFLMISRLLEWAEAPAGRRGLLAGFAAALYLLHPVQAEAVAYLAGRFEAVSVLFAYAAFTVFLYRRERAISWSATAAILALFAAGMLSKEHIVVLPALLLLTDFWWNPGFGFDGIRANWRLYLVMAIGAAGGVITFLPVLFHSTSAGFFLKDLPWYQYLFTQFRALFVYPFIFVFPVHLTADWDFPISKTLFDRGAIVGLIALIGLAVLAWRYRRRFPLASYGFFVYLLLMSPTSSILPIKDPVAERRLYFSMLGLLLIAVDLLGRLKVERRALTAGCAAVLLLAAIGAHSRAAVWADPVALWEDTVRKSPGKLRAHFQLATAYFDARRYDASIAEFEKSARIETPNYNLLADWGLAYDAMNRPDDALAKLRQAAALEPTAHIYSQIGMVYAKQRRWPEALEALGRAEKLDPGFAPTFNYRAKIHFQLNEICPAVADYRRALALDPRLTDAREELTRAEAQARASGGC